LQNLFPLHRNKRFYQILKINPNHSNYLKRRKSIATDFAQAVLPEMKEKKKQLKSINLNNAWIKKQ
jgi:hypothetical protein